MPIKKELKLKFKIRSLDRIKKKLKKTSIFLEKIEYSDYFFRSKNSKTGSELRLRKLEDKKLITLKTLFHKNDIQVNNEYKFKVDNADDFISFLEFLGYKPFCLLRKHSEVFMKDQVRIELAKIDRVGNFVELTLHTLDTFSDNDEKRLKELSSELGLKKRNIDSRYYSEIIKT